MSMFLDTAKISVKAGRGGDGMVAFRREKYVPNGGPWGGDGGKGGSVIFKVDEGLRTLMDFRYNRKFKAKNGEKGMTKGMHGRGAEDLIVSIPPGTTVRDAETGKVITDMVEDGQEFVIAHGGRGGRGPWRQGSRKGGDRRKSGKGREPGYRSEVKNISGAVGCKGGHDPGNGHGSLWERGLQKKDGGYEGAVPDHRGKRRGSGGQHPPEQLSPGGGFRRPGLLL